MIEWCYQILTWYRQPTGRIKMKNGLHSTKNTSSVWSSYWSALRPWSFTASLTPVLLGACLGYKVHAVFDAAVLIVVCVTALAVHAAGNLVNTYYDFKKGVDNKKSDDRTLVEGYMKSNDVATLGAVCYGLGCAGLVILFLISPAKSQLLSLMYFCGLSSSFLYTGGLGLKYIALGDIAIFITFGPITVMFSYLAMTGELSMVVILYAIPLAMNIECVLHVNNCRDADSDRAAGIITLAIILGKTYSYLLFCVLLFGPYIAFACATVNLSVWYILPLSTIVKAFSIERLFRSNNLSFLPHRIAELNLLLGIFFIVAIFFSPKSGLPFLFIST